MKTLVYLDDALKLISDTYWMTETEKATLSEKLKALPPVDAVLVQHGTSITHRLTPEGV